MAQYAAMINVKTKYMKFQFFRVNKKVVMLSRKTILEANLVFARRPQLEFATIGVTTLQSHDSCCRRRWQSEVSTEWGRKLWGAACSDLEHLRWTSASQQPRTLAWHKLHPHCASKATLSSRGKCQDFGSLQSHGSCCWCKSLLMALPQFDLFIDGF